MRLIDADELKTITSIQKGNFNSIEGVQEWIDKAPTVITRPTELYAIEDCITGQIIFNARGGCYRDIADANDKITRLTRENDSTYRIVKYVMTV